MKLSTAQQHHFWRHWKLACQRQGWPVATAHPHRYALLARAGFQSLTQVDPLAGFDRVIAELAALTHPESIAPQLRAAQMPRTRFIFRINELAAQLGTPPLGGSVHPYTAAILLDRYGHTDPDRLSLAELEQLRNTLASRATAHRRRAQERLATVATADPF